jgi:hypothetical protein
VKLQELRAAVYLVLGERGRAQVHRFGRRWVTGSDGRKCPFHPERLPAQLFWTWFTDEVRKTAEASVAENDDRERRLLDYGRSLTHSPDSLRQFDAVNDRLVTLPAEESDPLNEVLAAERQREINDRWDGLLAQATPSQRQLLQTLLALEQEGSTSSLVQAAQRLQRAPSTIRVQWKRLVDRARERVNAPDS